MTSTEQRVTHYLEQAEACERAKAELKKDRALRDKSTDLRKATSAYTLAARRWNDAARALNSSDTHTLRDAEDLVADAIQFHAKGNERRAALQGLDVELPPAAEPDMIPANLAMEDVAVVDTVAITNPDTGATHYRYSTGITADGRHVDIVEDATGEDAPLIGLHPNAESARQEMTDTAVAQLLDPIPYGPAHGALFISWGDHHQVSAVPHTGQTWRSAVRDGRQMSFAEHPSRSEAVNAALAAAEQIAERLMASPDRVAELGGLWMARRTAEARAEEMQRRFVDRLRSAKADRVVDRYGQITNDQLARLARVTVQAINKML